METPSLPQNMGEKAESKGYFTKPTNITVNRMFVCQEGVGERKGKFCLLNILETFFSKDASSVIT